MVTTLDIGTTIFKLLDASDLKTTISGGIYKDQSPNDSDKEDVVVNVITADAELIQAAVCNVNIHMPLLPTGLPNHARFAVIIDIAAPLLKEVNGDMWSFFIENQNFIRDNSTGKWYYNFRLRFKHHNTIIH